MAASGYTPVSLYYSTTPTQAPTGVNLVYGELAINIYDGKLYYKDNTGTVKVIAGTGGTGVVAGSNTQVQYNNNGVFGASANLTFNGTTLTANTLNLTNQLTTAYGGTGLTSFTAGDLPYYASGTSLSKLGIGVANQILTSTGTAPQWTTLTGVAVTTFSAGTTGLTPAIATSGAVTLGGTLITSNGGTGLTSYTVGDLPYYATGTALSKLGIGTSGQILTSTGTAPQWTTLSGVAVTTISGGTTGITPATATSGAVTLGGTLITSNGGTGLSTYTAGDMTYYTSGTALSKLTIGANKRIMTSTGSAPQWVASLDTTQGGTGLTTYTAGDLPYFATGTTLSKLGIGTSGQILTSSGTAPQWTTLSGVAVTSISFGTTGLTPATATNGAVTVAGTLVTSNGGTGLASYTAGDLLYYSTGTTLSKLGIGAANYVLTSSGSAPQWVAASTIAAAAAGSNRQIQYNNSGVLGASSTFVFSSSSLLGVGTSLPLGKLHVVGGNSNNIIADNNGEQYTTVQWYNNGVEKAQQYWDNTNALFVSGTDVSAAYAFKTNATERMRISGSTGNVSIGTASTPIKFLVNGTDAVGLPVGTTAERPTGAAGYVRFNSTTTEFEGYNGTAWASIGGSAISNDTTTATARYPLFASATTGTATTVYTSNAKYLYTPSTGELQAPVPVSSSGFFINAQTISASYTIADTNNAGSFGPVSVADSVTVTVSPNATWTVV